VNYLLRTDRKKKNEAIPICVRFTLDQKRVQLATGLKVRQEDWDDQSQLVKSNVKGAAAFNGQLGKIKTALLDIYYQCEALADPYDVMDIKMRFLGEESSKGLLETFDYYLKTIKGNLGKSYAPKTLEHYNCSRRKLVKYLDDELKLKDISLKSVGYRFLNGFDLFLKTNYKVHQNTAWNYHKHLRRVLNLAVSMGHLEKNPYQNFKVKLESVDRDFLTLEELKKLEAKEISLNRLSVVRDIFIFSCYTGLAYADISKLANEHLQKRGDGNYWIVINRTKTKSICKIPLFSNTLKILEKYAEYPELVLKGRLLPVSSNQKLNVYLKEIAEICEIKKNLTMHMARHTFATTVTLSNGVPIETVSKVLGHKSLKITQIYARVLEDKISEDMGQLKKKFGW
jgi:integrase